MSIKKPRQKKKWKTFQVTEELSAQVRKLNIDVSDTCRKALQAEVKRVAKGTK